MEKTNWKQYLPYAALPVIGLAFALLKIGRLYPINILQLEILIGFGYVISVGDIKEKRIPNMTVLLMLAAWVLINIPRIMADLDSGLSHLVSAVLGFGMAAAVFMLVYFFSRKGLGGGDVKFMAVSGLYLGIGAVMPAMLIGSVLSAVVCLILLALKKIARTDTIPLAPFLYTGMLVTIFLL